MPRAKRTRDKSDADAPAAKAHKSARGETAGKEEIDVQSVSNAGADTGKEKAEVCRARYAVATALTSPRTTATTTSTRSSPCAGRSAT